MGEQKNPHRDHRARLRAQFRKAGLDHFPAHNVLELLLFYPIPRRDTNPLAHALLSAFPSLEAVLSASPSALLSVLGIGQGAVRFLTAFSSLSERALSLSRRRLRLDSADRLGRYCCQKLEGGKEGDTLLIFMDNDFGVIAARRTELSVHSPHFPFSSLVGEALLCHASQVAVAHLHSDGLSLPASEDLHVTRLLRNTLNAAGIKMLEHLIVGGRRYTTLLYRHSGEALGRLCFSESEAPSEEEAALLAELFATAHIKADAASLLSSYGGLRPLLSATYAQHCYLGLDERTATLLSLPFAVSRYCSLARPVPACNDVPAIGRYLADYYRAVSVETVLLLLFNREGRHIGSHIVGVGSVREAGVSCRRVTENALFSGARSAYLSHNHPDGAATPSNEDRAVTDMIAESLLGLGVALLGHFVIGDNGEFVVL